jgi:hypothetical protein
LTRGARLWSLAVAAGAAALAVVTLTAFSSAAPVYDGWSAPVSLGPAVNTAAGEAGPALSEDGLSLYFDSDRGGGVGSRDIWVSHRATPTSAWGTPANLGPTVNSSSSEAVPSFSDDGHWMFFGSDRPGGFGGVDIYQSYRADIHDDFGWQAPTNLGANVNTTADENGSGYFANGGSPQLYFGSGRSGGLGGQDLYVSSRQADGTWGPAALILELSSNGADNRPTLRRDGLEIFFYAVRPAGGLGGPDLWTATRVAVGAPWSAPVNLGALVNGSAAENHPYLSADGRTLVYVSNRAGGAGGSDLYAITRTAQLTVTADDQSRLFAAGNPPLTATVTGFVGGDTAAVVSGAAACTTTATAWSPAGTYPIVCTIGSLAASGYSFATFVAGTLTVGYSEPCLTGVRTEPLTVSAGTAVCVGADAVLSGPVTVNRGGSLDVEGGRITGRVLAAGAATVRICGATIAGPLTITGSSGLVLVGGDAATGRCDPNAVTGPVTMSGNDGGVELNGNTVVGPVRVTGNAGSLPAPDAGHVHASGNTVLGPVVIQQ